MDPTTPNRKLIDAPRPSRRWRTLVVVVNYRTGALVERCLRTLSTEVTDPGVDARVIIVDNASGDGSAEHLRRAIEREGWSGWATLVEAPDNRGFAAGNNAALRPELSSSEPPDAVWLLNPDTEARAGALRALLDVLERRPKAGIAASRLENPDGSIQESAFRFHTWVSEIEAGFGLSLVTRLLRPWTVWGLMPAQESRVDWASGASLMVRREALDAVGVLDERYFMYYEETDLCLAAHRAGWECWYAPESRVVHLVGQSSGVRVGGSGPRRRPACWFESRRHYFLKNWGPWRAALADAGFIVGFLTWRLRRWLQGRLAEAPPQLLADAFAHSVFMKGFRIEPERPSAGASGADMGSFSDGEEDGARGARVA